MTAYSDRGATIGAAREPSHTASAGSVFDWPKIGGNSPIWTGHGFQVGTQWRAVLDYEAGESGWSDDLTLFHEDVGGDGMHPIDIASRRRARRTLKKYASRSKTQVFLEVGCSSGFLLRELIQDWPGTIVIGADYIAEPLNRLAAKLPTLPLLRFDLMKCPLPSRSCDAVVLLNVLEHIEDDHAAITQVARLLKPGGIAVIEVPAQPELYDAYDSYLKHFRRYRLSDLCRLLEQVGLRVAERSHLGFFVYPAFAFVKRRNRRALKAAEDVQRAVVKQSITSSRSTPLLKWTTAIEEHLGRWFDYPVGIRCVVTARKPPSSG